MRGRPSQLKVQIDDATRATLEGWLRRQTSAAGLATRARAMLLLAEGQPYTHTAAQVGLAERHVRKLGQTLCRRRDRRAVRPATTRAAARFPPLTDSVGKVATGNRPTVRWPVVSSWACDR